MRLQKVSDSEVLNGLTKVFRSKGYEGASLNDLSDATGLKKASLYHRFPNGKQEMADAVMNHIGEWVEDHVFHALLDNSIEPQARLMKGLEAIRTLYDGGKKVCVFRAFSLEISLDLFGDQIKNGMHEWISAFEKVGEALQLSQDEASIKAADTLIQIQGSLIVSKGLGDITVFERTLNNIEQSYIQK